jgi:signal transduction histidine kinase
MQNGEPVEQQTVLIVSDNAEFSRAISAHWQMERTVPAFTLVGEDLCDSVDGSTFDLAIVGAIRSASPEIVRAKLEASGKPLLFIASEAGQAKQIRESQPNVMVLRDHEGWLDALVLIATECLRREAFVERCQRLEHENHSLQSNAMLGRYVLDMRHAVNNALTSVLGNSELLLSEPGTFSAGSRAQIETIRNMAMRIHEVLQRFSSLEKELRCASPVPPTAIKPTSVAAGS